MQPIANLAIMVNIMTITKAQLLIKVLLVDASNTLAYRNLQRGKITQEKFQAITNDQLQQLENLGKIAKENGIE